MKVIIQIPCFNESGTLAQTVADLPRTLPGIDLVEFLIVDDGSSDDTVAVARAAGVDHIVHHSQNLGLARAFMTGIDACLREGADIIINTDADNQYSAADIPRLIEPILAGRAEMVVGARPIGSIAEFSALKKMLQRLGSSIMRRVSGTQIPDAPSGFRAFHRRVAMQLNVFSQYSYTLETIIQAGHKGFSIESVPVEVNPATRQSRLVKSIWSYIQRSMLTMLRIFVTYRPFRFFATLGTACFLAGFFLGARFLVYYFLTGGVGKVQSLILAALLLGSSLLLFLVGLVADLIAVNRSLLERMQGRLMRLEETVGELHKEVCKR